MVRNDRLSRAQAVKILFLACLHVVRVQVYHENKGCIIYQMWLHSGHSELRELRN